ncbi:MULTISPECIES: heavy-metal-associated domain-containing protein [Hymenobacter]|jgi:copper chaperone CopZ|uniref:Heavy-metal-associated domain-containing protein n=2 Tax=Hymenobacter TaxID=89966 RepID=A0A428IZH7_9BACT|nr:MULTISPECIES: heavy metal-associated domain-containing protein [Hymenobacter]RSK24515.1 heavy-metal-associated domain-containing protein [Hymenobacter metallilatus]TGE03524.1 heavy-metal-associated domain-containing protein [Hymenobacter fodinae]
MFAFNASKSVLLGALFTLSLATTACGQQTPSQAAPAAKTPAQLVGYTTATLPIEGMSCGSCVSNVKQTLKGLDGISTVAVSLEQRTATVAYDPQKVKPEQIQAAVNAKGYKAGALTTVTGK